MTKLKIVIVAGLVLSGTAGTILLQRHNKPAPTVEALPSPPGKADPKAVVRSPAIAGKVALLDQKRVFDSAPKTRAYDSQIRTLGRSMEQEDQRLREDATVSPEDKDRRIQEFRLKAQRELDDKKLQMRDEIVADISKATEQVARKKGYTLVLDRVSKKVIFAADQADLTENPNPVEAPLQTEYLKLVDLTQEVLDALSYSGPSASAAARARD